MNKKVLDTRALLDSFQEKMNPVKKPLKEGIEEASPRAPIKPMDNWNEAMWTEKRKQLFATLRDYCAQLIADLGVEDGQPGIAEDENVADIRRCQTLDDLLGIMDNLGYPADTNDLLHALLGE